MIFFYQDSELMDMKRREQPTNKIRTENECKKGMLTEKHPSILAYELLKPTIDNNRGEYTQDLLPIFLFLSQHIAEMNNSEK